MVEFLKKIINKPLAPRFIDFSERLPEGIPERPRIRCNEILETKEGHKHETHYLALPQEFFERQASGKDTKILISDKRLRLSPGDWLVIKECKPEVGLYTGRAVTGKIANVETAHPFPGRWEVYLDPDAVYCNKEITCKSLPQPERTQKTHTVKTLPEYYQAAASGIKKFELRKNDRDYHVADILVLKEWEPETGYTGRGSRAEITYIITESEFLAPGFAALGIEIIEDLP